MAASKKNKPTAGESLRTRKGKASLGFVSITMVALIIGALYLQVTDQWNVITGAATLRYQEWFEGIVNDPDNEEYRAQLIAHVVEHYRETPSRKSLPLRNDAGQVIGRFRINTADVLQPHQDDPDPARRRVYVVNLSGSGELWHDVGGRVRFNGVAVVTYHVDFKVEEWAAYAYFECAQIEGAKFEHTHIDNFLGKMFPMAVRNAGTEALEESLRPGFTVIAKSGGDTYLAAGRVGTEFVPRKGPYAEADASASFETIHNDTTLLHAGYRDYLGPIELFDDAELRITLEAESLEPRKSLGVDVYVLTEEQFQHFENFYPDELDKLPKLECIEAVHDMRKVNRTLTGLSGNVYILIDYTEFGSGKDPDDFADAGFIKYYVRAKR
ncbi:MAG: hypothetical protein K8I27_01530 [Planctomycetes bacterium]|nr:hypothetical protein [Planctomycetota bacterium]